MQVCIGVWSKFAKVVLSKVDDEQNGGAVQ